MIEPDFEPKEITDLPEEILEKIIDTIPSPYFYGQHSPALVCTQWNRLANGPHIKAKKLKIEDIIRECENDLDTALYTLTNPKIFNQLSFKNIFAIAGSHIELAKIILSNTMLSGASIALLGQNNEEVAQFIINDEKLNAKLTDDNWVQLSSLKSSISKIVYEKYKNKFDINTLELLGLYDFIVAKAIFEDVKLKNNLESHHLTNLGKRYVEIAKIILDDQNLLAKLSETDIAKLGQKHLKTAKRILADNALRKKLITSQYATLGILGNFNPKISQWIMDDEELQNILNEESLAMLGECNPEVAKQIMEKESLNKKVKKKIGLLVQNHPNLAMDVFNKMRKELSLKNLARLGEFNPEIGNMIWEDQELRAKFLENPSILARLAANNEQLATLIVNDKVIESFEPNDLYEIAENHPSIVETILKSNQLAKKLNYDQCIHLGMAKYGRFEMIMTNESISKQITSKVQKNTIYVTTNLILSTAKEICENSQKNQNKLKI